MHTHRPSRSRLSRIASLSKLAIVAMSLLAIVLVTSPSHADAQTASTPCPSYSIQDVFDDPSTDWDKDRVNNKDELYNGLNPCVFDTDTFCGTSGNVLCRYGAYGTSIPQSLCYSSGWAWADVHADRYSDWDNDGITNYAEARNGLNPCVHSCKSLTGTDVNLNPTGSWDNDGVPNRTEILQGTNPCNGYDFNPCPTWSTYQIDYMPSSDWDADGITNADEVRRGFNPCTADIVFGTLSLLSSTASAASAPISTPSVAASSSAAFCSGDYPYFHAGTCYSNPVTPGR